MLGEGGAKGKEMITDLAEEELDDCSFMATVKYKKSRKDLFFFLIKIFLILYIASGQREFFKMRERKGGGRVFTIHIFIF